MKMPCVCICDQTEAVYTRSNNLGVFLKVRSTGRKIYLVIPEQIPSLNPCTHILTIFFRLRVSLCLPAAQCEDCEKGMFCSLVGWRGRVQPERDTVSQGGGKKREKHSGILEDCSAASL